MRRIRLLLRGGHLLEFEVLDREASALEIQHHSAVLRRERGGKRELVGSYTVTAVDGAHVRFAWRDVLALLVIPLIPAPVETVDGG